MEDMWHVTSVWEVSVDLCACMYMCNVLLHEFALQVLKPWSYTSADHCGLMLLIHSMFLIHSVVFALHLLMDCIYSSTLQASDLVLVVFVLTLV